MHRWLGPVAVGALLAVAGLAAAQTYHWSDGDVRIMGAHPDLTPQDDDRVHSSGDYFSQIVLRGEDASEVEEIGFSFGKGPPSPEHHPGYAGAWDFRTDDTPRDGWFIPITASDTPDGQYKFALHAYATAGDPSSEIARFWGQSVVEDGDAVGPWPWVLPGETSEPNNPHGVPGVTVEFAENATARLWVDGEEVELTEWDPPAREDDLVPRHTADPKDLGPGYKWEGPVEEGTVLRVEAVDEAGNQVTKGALVGVGIDNPVIEVRFPGEPPAPAADGEAEVPLHVENVGLRTGNVTLSARTPAGLSAEIQPANLTLEPGASQQASLTLAPEDPSDADLAGAEVTVEAAYPAGGQPVASTFDAEVPEVPGDAPGTSALDEAEASRQSEAETQGTPAVGPGSVVGLLALAALGVRRWA